MPGSLYGSALAPRGNKQKRGASTRRHIIRRHSISRPEGGQLNRYIGSYNKTESATSSRFGRWTPTVKLDRQGWWRLADRLMAQWMETLACFILIRTRGARGHWLPLVSFMSLTST